MSRRSAVALLIAWLLVASVCALGLAAKATGKAVLAPAATSAKTGPIEGKTQLEPLRSQVMGVQQLRGQQRGLVRVQVRGAGEAAIVPIAGLQMQRLKPGAGSPAYAEGTGVVLDVLHPHDAATDSTLSLWGVFWNERVRQQVLEGSADTSFAIAVQRENQVAANAYFSGLPSAQHTYMLTIGTSAQPEHMRVRIGSRFLSSSQLVANPATSEVRALFTYQAGSYDNQLHVIVHFSPWRERDNHVHFHHIQLAQLD